MGEVIRWNFYFYIFNLFFVVFINDKINRIEGDIFIIWKFYD